MVSGIPEQLSWSDVSRRSDCTPRLQSFHHDEDMIAMRSHPRRPLSTSIPGGDRHGDWIFPKLETCHHVDTEVVTTCLSTW